MNVLRKKAGCLTAMTLGCLLAGCAGDGTLLSEKIKAGENAVASARESSASVSAAVELKSAEEKLAAARAAEVEKEYDKGVRLAEEAQVTADYARARADAVKARKTAEEMRAKVKALKKEVESMPLR